MRVPISWLREFVSVPDEVAEVARRLGRCGFAVDGVEGDVVDFDVTANRPDCLSVYGLAREAATAFDAPLEPYGTGSSLPIGQAPIKVSIGDAGCGRYALAVLDVTLAPSPAWLAARLHACGIRPINNVVDVTNYVMLELGQPMHAFDAAKLAGAEIRVRRARAGETMTTLDGQARTLDESMLVIADREKAIALAGVMGGATSEVSASTTRIALESAWFLPASVRITGRKVGLKTEASARFERGCDIGAPVAAIERAVALLAQIGAGTLSGAVADLCPRRMPAPSVALSRQRVARLLGRPIPDPDVERLLSRLGFALSATADGWSAIVPSWRVDVLREADLIEEVGRHWGLDKLPGTFPPLAAVPRPSSGSVSRTRLIGRLLSGAGVQEAVSFTFIERGAALPYSTEEDLVTIANPLSEKFAVLRPSMAPGLVESLVYNRNRQVHDVRLFEIGSVFSRTRGEQSAVGWVVTGQRQSHWSGAEGLIGFTDAKGLAELVADGLDVPIDFDVATDCPWLVRGQAAVVRVGGQRAGWVGRLATTATNDDPVFAGQLDLDALGRAVLLQPRPVRALPRFPTVVRDLAIVVDERLPAAKVRGTIRSNAPATLAGVREFDRYQGKGVPDGHVSLAIRLTFQHPERTLTDAEVQSAVDGIVNALEREHHALLRGR
jgi:phenylalanyl-tRNA synthetase beta chain